MEHENKPIEVCILPDHFSIEFEPLTKLDFELFDKFNNAKPEGMRDELVSMHGKEYILMYGTPKELLQFLWNVTQHFDLLLI